MSVQFGKCNLDGKRVYPQEFEEVRLVIAPYGPDREGFICKDNLGILYRAFHATKESQRETQPHVSRSGIVITWDGRLDNRKNLIERLAAELSSDSTDLEIVAAAYDRWGTDTFQQLIGDWAVSAWSPKDQSLVLAKDFVGARQLYYLREDDQITWSTILDPLVLLARHPLKVEEEYVAGWLALFPAPHLTPYVGIHAVPPSSFLCSRRGTETITKYWDFDSSKKIRYRADAQYEEQFRVVFGESVRRRLRSNSPVLAELSGGMDSSSIVCIADDLISAGTAQVPRLDTISYFNDSEPNWNERPYFTEVERRRGRVGRHVDCASSAPFKFDSENTEYRMTPATGGSTDNDKSFVEWVASQKHRIVLSGIGGDEVTGGIPAPSAEIADFFTGMHFGQLARSLKDWAISTRKPWLHLLLASIRSFCAPPAAGFMKHRNAPSWLNPTFAHRYRAALSGYVHRWHLFGPLPTFQENMQTLEGLRRQLAVYPLSSQPVHEIAYPYLDRDFLEFIYAIPPQQLIRPGQRRSLMRRALAGIVPDAILNRRRKAYVERSPLRALSPKQINLMGAADMKCGTLGVILTAKFLQVLEEASQGRVRHIVPLLRAITLESWLRGIAHETSPIRCQFQRSESDGPEGDADSPLRPRISLS